MRELDRPDGPRLAKTKPIAEITPGERALVLERQGPEALLELEAMLKNGRAQALVPEFRKRLVERAARVRGKLDNPGGYYCDLLKRAERGELAGVTRKENFLGAQLWELENEANGKGDFDRASKIRLASYEIGKELRAEIKQLRNAQAGLELRALFEGKPLPKALAAEMISAADLPSPKPNALFVGTALIAEVVTSTARQPVPMPKGLLKEPAKTRVKYPTVVDVRSRSEQLEEERNALEGKLLLPSLSRFLRPAYECRIQEIDRELGKS